MTSPFRFPISKRGSQKGFALLIIVAIFGAVALGYVLNESITLTKKYANYDFEANQQKILEYKKKLELVYIKNASQVDDPNVTTWQNFEAWQNNAGLTSDFLLQGAVSAPITEGEITYRNIGIWIPGDDLSPTFETATGRFVGCETVPADSSSCGYYVVINGRDIQKQNYELARNKLGKIAASAESYAAAKIRFNPLRPTGASPFRPLSNRAGTTGCSDRAPDELPCIDTFTRVDETPLSESESIRSLAARVLGLAEQEFLDPWNNLIEITNEFDNPANPSPPYTLQLRTITPWGAEIKVIAFYRV